MRALHHRCLALRLACFSMAAATLLSLSASAQVAPDAQGDPESAFVQDSRGLQLDRPGLSTRADGASVAVNPGMLALVEHGEVEYDVAYSDHLGTGQGVFTTLPIGGVLGLGAGFEWLRHDDKAPAFRRYQLGAGLGLAGKLGLGLRYVFYGSENSLDTDGFSSVDVGLTARLLPALIVSLAVEHANTPRYRGEWLDPIYRAGVGTVLLDGRLKLDASWVSGLRLQDNQVDAVLSVEPTDGLELFADGRFGDQFSRWGGGVELGFGVVGLSVAGYAATTADDSAVFDGVSAGLSLRTQPVRSLYAPSDRWVGLEIPGNAPERAPRSLFGGTGKSFADLLVRVEALADDPSVGGVVLYIGGLDMGYAQLGELRRAIVDLESRGKRLVAHLEDTSTRSYYLATACDRIYVSPGQVLAARGLATTLTFYRRAFDAIGVNPEFVKIDEYKTAPDAYLRDSATPEQLEQLAAYVDTLFDRVVDDIAGGRGLSPAAVRTAINAMPITPDEGIAMNLIDGQVHREDLAAHIESDLGLRAKPRIDDDYEPWGRRETAWLDRPGIAVITLDGPIVQGPNVEVPLLGMTATGSKTISAALDWAVRSPKVDAIVLRVDSPGGSAHASEIIYRSVQRAAEAKPVIVSMGNIAASGGYYVAAPGHLIFASDMTLTGSIGVFAGKFDVSGLLDWLGVSVEIVKRGAFADLFDISAPWSPEARAQVEGLVAYLYDVFVDRVATGRKMSPQEVNAVSQGRVWTGPDALENGLVDRLGGLLDAIDAAKDRAGIPADTEVNLIALPPRGPLSAYDAHLPGDIVGALTGADDPELPEAAALDWSPLLGGFDTTALLMLLYTSGEALALVPFDVQFE